MQARCSPEYDRFDRFDSWVSPKDGCTYLTSGWMDGSSVWTCVCVCVSVYHHIVFRSLALRLETLTHRLFQDWLPVDIIPRPHPLSMFFEPN
jgi:hypothetical protein